MTFAAHKHRVSRTLDNTFGMILYSRYPLRDPVVPSEAEAGNEPPPAPDAEAREEGADKVREEQEDDSLRETGD